MLASLCRIGCVLGLVVAAGGFEAGCSSSKGIDVGDPCKLNSDCNSPLLCKLGSCRKACVTSVDCDNGGRCVTVDGVAVCQAPKEAACSATGSCTPPLVCRAVDNTCRSACTSSTSCLASQTCTGSVCVDTSELVGGSGKDGSAGAGGGTDAGSAGVGETAGSGGGTGSAAVAISVPGLGAAGFNYTQGSYITGFVFRANSVINITQFGYYDSNLTGGVETFAPHPVGVYDLTTHTLLGSATVQPSDPVTGLFHYVSLTNPIALNTTDTYAIVGVTGTNQYTVGITAREAPVNAALTYVSGAGYGPSNSNATMTCTLVEPNAFDAGNIFGQPVPTGTLCDFGPNFMFTTGSGVDAGVDAPIASPADAATGGGGSGGSLDGATGGTTSTGGSSGTGGGCLNPMTTFPRIAKGDSNNSFTSGAAALTANNLFIFSAYSGPDPAVDGGGAAINAVFVQSFDPNTSASRGAAHLLFPASTSFLSNPADSAGHGMQIYGAATAPTGQIAIIYTAGFSYPEDSPLLYAAFFDPSANAGATPTFVQLDTNAVNNPTVTWSNGRNAFVMSWTYNQGFSLKVHNFSPGGLSVGGNSDPVPTNDSTNRVNRTMACRGVGESGNYLGVPYFGNTEPGITTGAPFLTILDRSGNEVGTPLQIGASWTQYGWVTLAGTPQGFVYITGVAAGSGGGAPALAFLPTSGGASVVNATVDAGTFNAISFTRPDTAYGAYAVSDNVGTSATGGVGVLVTYADGLSFEYVSPDGAAKQSASQVIAHSWDNGYDDTSLMSFNGRFVVSLYDAIKKSTQAIVSGCP